MFVFGSHSGCLGHTKNQALPVGHFGGYAMICIFVNVHDKPISLLRGGRKLLGTLYSFYSLPARTD